MKIDFKALAVAQLSAYWGWMTEQGLTPELVVDTSKPGISMPTYLLKAPTVILNVSNTAANRLSFDAEGVSCDLSFGGRRSAIFVPHEAIFGLRARELKKIALLPMLNFSELQRLVNGEVDDSPPTAEPARHDQTSRAEDDAKVLEEVPIGETVVNIDFRAKKRKDSE